jgi:putative hydrolase of the HAD superfamily
MVVFFDLDATLLDHDAAARAGAARIYENFRPQLDENLEDFLERWESVSEKYFQSFDPGKKYGLWEQRRLRIREFFSEAFSDAEAERRFKIYLEAYEAGWKLFSDSLPCLQSLQRRKLGLITNGDGEQQRAKIQKLGLGSYLSHVVISREVNCAKPERAIFELAAREAKVDIQECVYVGDRLQTDALGSQQAGMKGIWLDRKDSWTGEEMGVPVIKSLVESPELLE